MEQESRRKFRLRMDAKQDVWRAISALMGNGNGVVEVPNQPGYVYIRIGDGDLGQAFNNRCPLADNLAIYVGYDPVTDPERRIFQVLSVRMTDYANAGNTIYANVPNHHATHEFGGGDDVYVDWRRLLGFRVGRPAAFTVTVDQGVIMRAGAWAAITSQTVNLAASQPGGVNSARYTLISLDAAGTVTMADGAIVSAALLDISDCPTPAANEIPLAAVRLYSTQTQISDVPGTPDIIDLRFPQTYMAGGSNIFGAGTQYQLAVWTNANTIAGLGALGTSGSVLRSAGAGANPAWSTFYLSGTAGGTTNFAVTGTKTLTLTAADDYNLTVPATGTAALGTGTATRLAVWSGTNTLAAGTIIQPAANVLTLLNSAASTLSLAITAAKTLTLTATDDYNLTIPATGTAALGTGAADTLTKWSATNVLTNIVNAAGYLKNDGAGTFTWDAGAIAPHAIDGADHTVAGRTAGQVLIATAAATFGWSGFLLSGTTGGMTNFAVTNTKTLTLTATDDYNLTAERTGAVIVRTPSTGFPDPQIVGNISSGNARGQYAVDLQLYVGGATYVASGTYSAILGGASNTASGLASIVCGGAFNIAAGQYSWAGGRKTKTGANDGVFIWGGYVDEDFNGIVANEFAIRARGGFRHAYDDSNYWQATVSAAGAVTFNATGASAGFTFSDAVTVPTPITIGTGAIATTAAGALSLAITAAKTLTLTATDDYNLTIPATGTAALLGTANVFTTSQGITLSTNASVTLTVTNANAGASANAGFYAISDTVTASYLVYSAASGGGARLNLVASGGYMIIGTSTNHKVEFYMNNVLTMSFPTTGGVTVAGELRAGGDNGGLAATNALTGVSNIAANSTGVGTIKFKGATNRDSTGFIKIYIGTTAYYVPVFSAITG